MRRTATFLTAMAALALVFAPMLAEARPGGGASSGSFTQKSYTMLDLGGSYKLNKTVTLYAGIYNLLDKQVIYDGVNYDTVLDGRRYWLGMNVKF